MSLDRRTTEELFAQINQVSCLVIGDLMLDEYLWGRAERISPEAPVQVVDVLRDDTRLGGAGNVVNNLLVLGCQVTAASVIGADASGVTLTEMLTARGVDTRSIFVDPARHTIQKTRVMAAHQQIVRIDRETRSPLSSESEQALCNWLRSEIPHFSVVLLSDYQKGVLTEAVLKTAISSATAHGIPVLVDPKGSDFSKYRGATCLTPNRKEAEVASGITISDDQSLEEAARSLIAAAGLSQLLITRSEEGMSLFNADGSAMHIPTVAREVFDVTGAGDTVLSVLACGMAGGLTTEDAARLANIAAGLVVAKMGTATVTPREIIDAVGHDHHDTDAKIKSRTVLAATIATLREQGKSIVFTNGCFDLLHVGHVKYLQAARQLGDLLILGLNSDASIKRLKGPRRPLIGQDERAHLMAALDCIDYVCIFDEDTPLTLIEAVKPSILVKGGDYTPEGVVGKDLVESYGGRVELIPFVDGKSTSTIIEQILERYSEE